MMTFSSASAERSRVLRRHKQPIHAIFDLLSDPADIRADQSKPAQCRFGKNGTECLRS